MYNILIAMLLSVTPVEGIRSSFEKGEYKEFLTEMDASYKSADVKGLIDMRQNVQGGEWEEQLLQLQKMRNEELLQAVGDEKSEFADKVRSMAAEVKNQEAITKLAVLISKAPGAGKNADENRLIDIDVEYEYKMLEANGTDKLLALRMEKMAKMVEASKDFTDEDLKSAVAISAASLDERLAHNLDASEINNMVRSGEEPQSETEAKVFSIIKTYQSQFMDLMKNIGQ